MEYQNNFLIHISKFFITSPFQQKIQPKKHLDELEGGE